MLMAFEYNDEMARNGKASIRFEMEPELKEDFERLAQLQGKTVTEALQALMREAIEENRDVLTLVKERFGS
ncbi:MAG: hypothetical protein HC795_08215 [Coleofasciculaceae cyanobacterium RL_1_1]|nr:hypothetical protein [Coleofasciculaceae cyanobacterium RL_1_1]